MIGYLAWTQTVFRAALRERPLHEPATIEGLALEVGLPLAGLSMQEHNDRLMSLDRVLRDLGDLDLLDYESDGHAVGYRPDARRWRTEPLTSAWPKIAGIYLDPDEETFLGALTRLSEKPGVDRAHVQEVSAEDVFSALGWEWDGSRAFTIYGRLMQSRYVAGRVYGGPAIFARITYAGVVRATDDTAAVLREARDHLAAGRLRAAGCIAAVELERRLKGLVVEPPTVSSKRDPTLEDYNQAAFRTKVIDQETWGSVSNLAVIRKRCVHVLDREPETDEVRILIEGVERILRRYPRPESEQARHHPAGQPGISGPANAGGTGGGG